MQTYQKYPEQRTLYKRQRHQRMIAMINIANPNARKSSGIP